MSYVQLHYRLQTKFAKVMFSRVSVCPLGACVAGGHVWQGECIVHPLPCMPPTMHTAPLSCMSPCHACPLPRMPPCHAHPLPCMSPPCTPLPRMPPCHACPPLPRTTPPPPPYMRSMCGRYASYWNAFL